MANEKVEHLNGAFFYFCVMPYRFIERIADFVGTYYAIADYNWLLEKEGMAFIMDDGKEYLLVEDNSELDLLFLESISNYLKDQMITTAHNNKLVVAVLEADVPWAKYKLQVSQTNN